MLTCKTKRYHCNWGPIYTITKYGKVNRLTIPANNKVLLMVNTEPDLDPHEIVDDVIALIRKYSDDPNYEPKKVFWASL